MIGYSVAVVCGNVCFVVGHSVCWYLPYPYSYGLWECLPLGIVFIGIPMAVFSGNICVMIGYSVC